VEKSQELEKVCRISQFTYLYFWFCLLRITSMLSKFEENSAAVDKVFV